MHRSVRERAVLAGSSTGLSLSLYGYPIVECFLGGRAAGAALAMQSVAMLDLVNHVAGGDVVGDVSTCAQQLVLFTVERRGCVCVLTSCGLSCGLS